jgi:hypothetical protein
MPSVPIVEWEQENCARTSGGSVGCSSQRRRLSERSNQAHWWEAQSNARTKEEETWCVEESVERAGGYWVVEVERRNWLRLKLCPHIVDPVDTDRRVDNKVNLCWGSVRFQSTSIDSVGYVWTQLSTRWRKITAG